MKITDEANIKIFVRLCNNRFSFSTIQFRNRWRMN